MQLPAAEMFPPAERRGRIFIPRKSFSASSLSLRIFPCQRFHSCCVKWGCGVTHRFPSMVRSLNYKALNYLCCITLRVYICKQNILYIMYFVTRFPLKNHQYWVSTGQPLHVLLCRCGFAFSLEAVKSFPVVERISTEQLLQQGGVLKWEGSQLLLRGYHEHFRMFMASGRFSWKHHNFVAVRVKFSSKQADRNGAGAVRIAALIWNIRCLHCLRAAYSFYSWGLTKALFLLPATCSIPNK